MKTQRDYAEISSAKHKVKMKNDDMIDDKNKHNHYAFQVRSM